MELAIIIIFIVVVVYWFIKISTPKDDRFSDEDWKADRKARKAIKKQLKDTRKKK